MSLMCECDTDWYPEPGDWYWPESPNKYTELSLKRRKKCCSCHEFIEIGAVCTEHHRVKVPNTDIEVRIYGEEGEIPLAPDRMCESCSDLFFSLTELGYCVSPRQDMRELAKEYAETHKEVATHE